MKTILQAENLTKVYRVGSVDVPALRGVSLDVEEGEFLAIMGPSGCGKSTLLHLLGGLLTPTSGRIVIDDEDLTAASDARRTDIRRRKIGFVFQRFNLFPTLTAEGNLRLAERIHAGGRDGDKEAEEQRREVLKLLKLEDKMHHKPLELSGGEQQRVAVARAFANDPAIFLADEPTGNLDSRNGQHVFELMLALNRRRGATLVLVTHEQELASRADRRIFLRDGQVVADETSSPSDPNETSPASESNATGPSGVPDATERASDSDATASAEESNANSSAEELEAARP